MNKQEQKIRRQLNTILDRINDCWCERMCLEGEHDQEFQIISRGAYYERKLNALLATHPIEAVKPQTKFIELHEMVSKMGFKELHGLAYRRG